MERNTKAILIFIAAAIILIAGYRYQQYVLQKNFTLVVNTQCDPALSSCFAADCDPAEDDECDTAPYEKVTITDSYAPACLEEHTCENFLCPEGSDCEITYCSDDTLDEGETCADQNTADDTGNEVEE